MDLNEGGPQYRPPVKVCLLPSFQRGGRNKSVDCRQGLPPKSKGGACDVRWAGELEGSENSSVHWSQVSVVRVIDFDLVNELPM